MPFKFFDVDLAYATDNNLKKEDVKTLLKWVEEQPHLPEINEAQAILFFQRWEYQKEAAQNGIDSYFTFKSSHPIFSSRNPSKSPLKEALDFVCISVLPRKTPDGDTIVFIKLIDANKNDFNLDTQLKYFDMVLTSLYQQENSLDFVVLFDMKDTPEWIIGELEPNKIQQFWHYMHNLIPLRLRKMHYFNITPFVDEFVSALNIKKELLDQLYCHKTINDLLKYIPKECLPQDYGGTIDSVADLHEKTKNELLKNADFFEWEDQQEVDEKKRPGSKTVLPNF